MITNFPLQRKPPCGHKSLHIFLGELVFDIRCADTNGIFFLRVLRVFSVVHSYHGGHKENRECTEEEKEK
jgi:hypothetical protein